MRIADTNRAGIAFEPQSPKGRNATARAGQESAQDEVSFQGSGSLSLPEMLRLTEPGHPQRESFLSALSQSLRAGLHETDPSRVATSILQRGFDRLETAE
jgi:hypothetical protein